MKIGRFRDHAGRALWGVVDREAGTVRPLVGGPREWGPALTASPEGTPQWGGDALELVSLTLLAPLERTAKVVAAGATYTKHVEGLGEQMPEKPAAFLKPFDAIIGPDEEIAYPALTNQLDYEVELVVVIGSEDSDGLAAVLGYTVGNDVSARDLQFGAITGMDLFSSKGLDRTTGLGPWIVTRDEFGDSTPDLELTLTVDGETRQRDRTSSLAWGLDVLLEYVNARSRLHPGDVLFTGTPAGVGYEDGRYLQPGQEVIATVERVGSLRNVVAPRP